MPSGPWAIEREGDRTRLSAGGRTLSVGDVIGNWRTDHGFREAFLAELARLPASYWETPPIRGGSLAAPYEHVLLPAPIFERTRTDPAAFADVFGADSSERDVIAFANLGGDAVLVVPRPTGTGPGYGHLGAFLQAAPAGQQHELLIVLAEAIEARLARNPSPLWVSTAGLGVPWLHVRLDSRPKYYKHLPYRTG